MSTRRSRRLPRWASWIFVLSLVGYPLLGLIATVMNWESSIVSIPFRAIMLVASLVVILQAAARSPWWRGNRWLLLFWFAYLVRLLWDLLVVGVPGAAEALGVFLTITLLPSLAAGLAATRGLSGRDTAWRLVVVGGAVCTLAIAIYAFGWGAAQTLSAEVTLGRLAFEAVNPITLGHVATTTLIAVLCLTQRGVPPARLVALIAIGAAAGSCLLLAGSRGPMLALTVCSLVFALATGRWRWIVLMSLLILPEVLNPEGAIWARIATGGEDESSLERLVLQANAIAQFIDNPVLGSAFTELELLTYPHNLFIETAMALGLVGLALLSVLAGRVGRCAWRSVHSGELLFALLLLQYFVAAQFSGAIWGAAPLWICVAVVGRLGFIRSSRTAMRSRPTTQSSNLPVAAQ